MNQGRDWEARMALLRAARRVQQGWCQWAGARTASGDRCVPQSPFAVRFCARGAIGADGCPDVVCYAAVDAADRAAKERGWPDLVCYNDARERTQAEVVSLLLAAREEL